MNERIITGILLATGLMAASIEIACDFYEQVSPVSSQNWQRTADCAAQSDKMIGSIRLEMTIGLNRDWVQLVKAEKVHYSPKHGRCYLQAIVSTPLEVEHVLYDVFENTMLASNVLNREIYRETFRIWDQHSFNVNPTQKEYWNYIDDRLKN